MVCASTSELAAAETQLDDTALSLSLEGGALAPASKPAEHPTVVLVVLCVAQFLSALDVFIVNVALRKIGVGIGASSLSDLSWVLNAYAIVIAALLIPAGRLADLFGRKRGFLLGLGVFVAASVGAAASSSLSTLIGFRVLQAAGAAVLVPTSLGLLIVAAPPEKREFQVKIWTASAALAAASGPVIGGLLVQLSWRWIFLINIPVGLVAIVVAVRFVPDVKRQVGARLPDLIGSLLLVVAIAALALGLVRAPYWGWTGTRTLLSFAVSAVALPAFVWRSARHPAPVLDLNLLRSRVLSSAERILALLLRFVRDPAPVLRALDPGSLALQRDQDRALDRPRTVPGADLRHPLRTPGQANPGRRDRSLRMRGQCRRRCAAALVDGTDAGLPRRFSPGMALGLHRFRARDADSPRGGHGRATT